MSIYRKKYNHFLKNFDYVLKEGAIHYKGSVDTYNDLPVIAMTEGDMWFTKDTDHLYVWTIASATGALSDYDDLGVASGVDWTGITNKPSSSVVNIDDAVTKKHDNTLDHTQNTDVILKGTGEILNEKQTIHDSDSYGINAENSYDNSQTFISNYTGDLTKIELKLYKYDSTDPLIIEIRSTSEGLPTTSVLATHTIQASEIVNNRTWTTKLITFASPAPIITGVKYAIVFRSIDADQWYIGDDGNNNSYTNGESYYTDAGEENWIVYNNFDAYFRIYTEIVNSVDAINNGTLKVSLLVDDNLTIDGRDLSVDGTKLDTIEEDSVALSTVKADTDVADAITKKHSTHDTDDVTNNSSVTGALVTDALNSLLGDVKRVFTFNLPTTTIADSESIQLHRFTVPAGKSIKIWGAGLSSEAGSQVSGAKIQIYNETDVSEEYSTNATIVTGNPIDTLSVAEKDISIKILNGSGLQGDFNGFIAITLE